MILRSPELPCEGLRGLGARAENVVRDGAGGEGGFPARPGVAGLVRGRVSSRVQVNRQITMMEAGASMPLSRPDPGMAADPAISAAPTAIPAIATAGHRAGRPGQGSWSGSWSGGSFGPTCGWPRCASMVSSAACQTLGA